MTKNNIAEQIILAQESLGQNEMVTTDILPKEMIHGCTKEQLENIGIVFGQEVDDLFINVGLPEGWKKVASNHSMWSYLYDDKERKRAAIFYKGSFHDRKAHISLINRFSMYYTPEDEYKTDMDYEERKGNNWFGFVKDQDQFIFKTDFIRNPSVTEQSKMIEEARNWLENQYPEWEDTTKYWE